MPLLFALGIHGALEQVASQFLHGESLFACLDDVFVVAEPACIRPLYDALAATLLTVAGIQLNEGKTQMYNSAGQCPVGMSSFGEEVWSPSGVKVLGIPFGRRGPLVGRP